MTREDWHLFAVRRGFLLEKSTRFACKNFPRESPRLPDASACHAVSYDEPFLARSFALPTKECGRVPRCFSGEAGAFKRKLLAVRTAGHFCVAHRNNLYAKTAFYRLASPKQRCFRWKPPPDHAREPMFASFYFINTPITSSSATLFCSLFSMSLTWTVPFATSSSPRIRAYLAWCLFACFI